MRLSASSGWTRSALLFTGGALAAFLMLVMLHGRTERASTTQAEMAAVLQQAAPAIRQYYPQGSQPLIALPGGGTESVRSVLDIRAPMRFGSYVWNTDNIPAGPVWVRVDLERQILSVFRGGHEIGSAVILYGTDGKPTPTGRFTVLQKDADYHSRTYDAPMPYMLRLTDDGVAIHASNVRDGWATHGCIGVPLAFARLLFAEMQQGDMVAIMPALAHGVRG